jgi:hypothetical protein
VCIFNQPASCSSVEARVNRVDRDRQRASYPCKSPAGGACEDDLPIDSAATAICKGIVLERSALVLWKTCNCEAAQLSHLNFHMSEEIVSSNLRHYTHSRPPSTDRGTLSLLSAATTSCAHVCSIPEKRGRWPIAAQTTSCSHFIVHGGR